MIFDEEIFLAHFVQHSYRRLKFSPRTKSLKIKMQNKYVVTSGDEI